MIDFDSMLLGFIRQNIVTLSLAIGILGIIFKRLHWGMATAVIDYLKGFNWGRGQSLNTHDSNKDQQ